MISKNKNSFVSNSIRLLQRLMEILIDEYRLILKDPGLITIFLVATLVYPLLYSAIYKNETLRDMPIAVVDESMSADSRNMLRRLDATPDLKIIAQFNNIINAQKLFYQGDVHGIIWLPKDYSHKIHRGEQATIAIYADMSSFMYYRTLLIGANNTVAEVGKNIKLQRINDSGITGKQAEITADPFTGEGTILYNSTMGFASFFIPALLILILHQTLFFGITMIYGTAREENRWRESLGVERRKTLLQILLGKSLCYFTMYIVLSAYILLFVPHIFNFPHLGNPIDIMLLAIPFVLAVIFFSMTLSVFIRNRETGLIAFIFTSVVLLFLSGFSFPQSNIHWVWRTFGMLFPSTFGIQAYLKINSMGANIHQVSHEIITLWVQTLVYLISTIIAYRVKGKR